MEVAPPPLNPSNVFLRDKTEGGHIVHLNLSLKYPLSRNILISSSFASTSSQLLYLANLQLVANQAPATTNHPNPPQVQSVLVSLIDA